MEHRPLSELSSVADLKIHEEAKAPVVLSKRDRLDRWIELLEQKSRPGGEDPRRDRVEARGPSGGCCAPTGRP